MTEMSEKSLPNVIVIGAGGVGVITAVSLCHRGRSQVSLVVRSDYEHVKEHGYSISSCDYGQLTGWKPHNFVKSVEDASNDGKFYDFVVVTTKNIPDGPVASTVPEVIRPVIESNHRLNSSRQTNILLVQNGLDIEKDIHKAYDSHDYNLVVLSGIQLIGSTKIGKGVIEQVGKDHLSVGPFDPKDDRAIAAAYVFIDLYNNEGHNRVTFDSEVRYARWRKLMYNAVINTTTALVGMDVPRCLQFGVDKVGTEKNIFRPGMREIIAIAASEGIKLNEKDLDFFCNISKDLMFKPSMCVDFLNGQLMELETILGNPLRIAEKNGVSTPVLFMLYHLLFMVQNKLKESNGLLKFDEKKARIVE